MTTTGTVPEELSQELQDALEGGSLSQETIRELITVEARELNLSFDEAVDAAGRNALPKTPIGYDIYFLVKMLVS